MSPLPSDPHMAWPPSGAVPSAVSTWRAWYAGNPAQLAAEAAPPAENRYARAFFFWRRQRQPTSVRQPPPLHVPLAAEIAQTSADLLFGEMPDLQVSKPVSDRLDELISETGVANTLLEAAEVCAAISGVYLRVSWDKAVSDMPFLTTIPADRAVPEFASGRLQAVTFWRELPGESRSVWRHLERHEPGYITHGLYYGDKTTLGDKMPLAAHPQTADLEEVIEIPKEIPGGMLAWYVPNMRPLHDAPGSPHGRADIAGAESLLDALDEAWSSWARDVRLGKARIILPHDALDPANRDRGAGRYFDHDREIFTELDGMDPKEMSILASQPAIRAPEHEQTVMDLIERIVSKCGYSPQTFGLRIEGRAESGTALRLREAKTYQTIDRKRRYWAPALKSALAAMLAVDRVVFGRPTVIETPVIVWPEPHATAMEIAQTLTMLRTAEAVSVETAVRMAQPDLDEDGVAEEVARIRADSGRGPVPEPEF